MSFVYFIRAEEVGRVKIGHSADPKKRLGHLSVGSPCKLSLAAAFPGGRQVERAIHAMFAFDRARGEWFIETPKLTALIEGHPASMPRRKLRELARGELA